MKIIEIERGKAERSHFIYAHCVDEHDRTVISATLDYILGACLQRGYTIENWQEVQDFLSAEFDQGAHPKICLGCGSAECYCVDFTGP